MKTIHSAKEIGNQSSLPDLVVFTGGSDVDPTLYGDEKHPYTSIDTLRDQADVEVYRWAKENNIPCVGICRGGQFLNVMNGGKMYQHVENHGRNHLIHGFNIKIPGGIEVTSTHHQMMIVPKSGTLIAWAIEKAFSDEFEPEVVWFEDSKDLCVQYHPEYMDKDSDGYEYFQQLLEEYFDK